MVCVIVANLSEVIFEFDSFNFSNFRLFLANNPKIQIPIKRTNSGYKKPFSCRLTSNFNYGTFNLKSLPQE
jgi:hypothetical protein